MVVQPTFQEQHPKLFKRAFFAFLYPPGIEKIIKSRILRNCFWYLSFAPILISFPYVISYIHYLIFTPPDSMVLYIQIFRRALIITYMASQLMTHVLRFSRVSELFTRWNDVINKDYCTAERKLILDGMVSRSLRHLIMFASVRFSMSTLYNIPLFFNRYERSSELAGMPHDNNSPYHFYFVAYQTILFFWIGPALIAFECLFGVLMCMAEAEIKVLTNKLPKILRTVQTTDDGNVLVEKFQTVTEVTFGDAEYKTAVEKINTGLLEWVNAHQLAYKWIEDLKNLAHLNITLKYLYLGMHCSLVVIGLSGMSAMYNDLLLILTVTFANFSVCFYSTYQADRLFDNMEGIFWDAYEQAWYLLPLATQKALSIIAMVCQSRPVQFVGIKIYKDNKENFMAVLQTAYQILTFILPMAEG